MRRGIRVDALNEGRSVNPGYTSRSRTAWRRPRTLNEGRSVNPGYTPPTATSSRATPPLNEGRSVNPGYTRMGRAAGRGSARSTKAGASTPATLVVDYIIACACANAQRRPERQPRLHKNARASAVMTSIPAQRRPERQPRLHSRLAADEPNEGRSVNPGYTPTDPAVKSLASARSTKAGASTPATLLNSAKGQYRDKPSLVHGCGSLDNDAFASISRDFGRYPVRMVRIKQSRLP